MERERSLIREFILKNKNCLVCKREHDPRLTCGRAARLAINGAINNVYGSAINNSQAGFREQASRSEETVAEVERSGEKGFQRVVRDDDGKPVGVPVPVGGKESSDKAVVENDGMERCLDSGGRTANRRTREAYNAYMRGYMARRRLRVAYG